MVLIKTEMSIVLGRRHDSCLQVYVASLYPFESVSACVRLLALVVVINTVIANKSMLNVKLTN